VILDTPLLAGGVIHFNTVLGRIFRACCPFRLVFSSTGNSFNHVTCRGNERRVIYRDDMDRQAFLTRLAHCLKEYQLHGYVLMGNHFHLLLESLRGNLSEAMRQFIFPIPVTRGGTALD